MNQHAQSKAQVMVERAPHPGPLPIGSADAEREKRSQFFGETVAAICSKAGGFYEISQRLFLLPWGEGQDEGERSCLSSILKARLKVSQFGLPVFVFLIAITGVIAQQIPTGHATDFVSNTYFEPPNEQQVKMKLSGKEASPLSGGLLDVKHLQIESFTVAGKPEMIVRAPQCNYAPLDAVANSAGRLEMQTADGKFRVEGEGFLWRQNDQMLIISNRVHTVIDLPALQPPA